MIGSVAGASQQQQIVTVSNAQTPKASFAQSVQNHAVLIAGNLTEEIPKNDLWQFGAGIIDNVDSTVGNIGRLGSKTGKLLKIPSLEWAGKKLTNIMDADIKNLEKRGYNRQNLSAQLGQGIAEAGLILTGAGAVSKILKASKIASGLSKILAPIMPSLIAFEKKHKVKIVTSRMLNLAAIGQISMDWEKKDFKSLTRDILVLGTVFHKILDAKIKASSFPISDIKKMCNKYKLTEDQYKTLSIVYNQILLFGSVDELILLKRYIEVEANSAYGIVASFDYRLGRNKIIQYMKQVVGN